MKSFDTMNTISIWVLNSIHTFFFSNHLWKVLNFKKKKYQQNWKSTHLLPAHHFVHVALQFVCSIRRKRASQAAQGFHFKSVNWCMRYAKWNKNKSALFRLLHVVLPALSSELRFVRTMLKTNCEWLCALYVSVHSAQNVSVICYVCNRTITHLLSLWNRNNVIYILSLYSRS